MKNFIISMIWIAAGIMGIILMLSSGLIISSLFLFNESDIKLYNFGILFISVMLFAIGAVLYFKGTHR
ncbi:hypothetical protein BJF91_19975 [Allorhizobium taibaishanense]|uniref:Uncharacterized protein n=1 Tax=Allorhizobium taibaishanense TaxID=887144 RepID=A0A1Q9A424_9HYPH|nr:hypothetical protein BJF91_19975 [Allorhizobium taibaishanense]